MLMLNNGVFGIVVTFHPPPDVVANLRKVRSQMEGLVVIDNGSSSDSLAPLRAAAYEIDFQLIENGKNLGIAAALNIGVRAIRSEGFEWIAFFDQDSTVDDRFVESMLAEHASRSPRENIGILAARSVHRDTRSPLHSWPLKNGELQVTQTSGSMIPLSVFEREGEFIEDLFIDMVDFEFSLRLHRHGYKIVECPNALLFHSPGALKSHSLWGKVKFTSSNYGPARRYYIHRNTIWIVKTYGKYYPGFSAALLSTRVRDFVKVLLVENHRMQKVISTFQGFADGLAGRMGKRVEL
jgi:rhamnosyltransferase